LPEWIVIFYPINFLSAYVLYIYLYNRRTHIDLHLGRNITMVAAAGLALGTGLIFINIYPLHFLEAALLSVIIGGLSGILFGNLFNYKTILAGCLIGLIMGFTAPIAGAAASEGIWTLFTIEIFIIICFCLAAFTIYKA
jgi:hypothetical protein